MNICALTNEKDRFGRLWFLVLVACRTARAMASGLSP
jgi:hypothetical protein